MQVLNSRSIVVNISSELKNILEGDNGIPDISNLEELSKIFGVSIDYLINNDKELPVSTMILELDKTKYKNKLDSYNKVLTELYPEPYQIYILTKEKKINVLESIFDFIVGAGTIDMANVLSDTSPYYLVIKENAKLLVNIKSWKVIVYNLPENTNTKKFIYNNYKFTNQSKLK